MSERTARDPAAATRQVPVELRRATVADLPAIAEIRVRSWQRAYAGMIPAEYLAALSPRTELIRRYRTFYAADRTMDEYVAVLAGAVVGWAAVGPYRGSGPADPTDPTERRAGEVGAIYLHPDHWSRGIGEALMWHVLAALAALGRDPVLLWVLAENTRARRFYERIGFRPDGATQEYPVAGVSLPELRYRYDEGRR